MSKREFSIPKINDPTRNSDGTLKSREEYERAIREQYAQPTVTQGFARSSTELTEDLARRQYREPTAEDIMRREQMKRPPPRAPSPKGSVGTISGTLLRHRARVAELERIRQEQLAFYAMLEQRYGAVKGDDDSYLVAMERYEYDKEKQKKQQEKRNAGTMVPFQSSDEVEAIIRGMDDEVRKRLHNATLARQRADAHLRAYEREKARKEEEEIERLRREAERIQQEAERLRREHIARMERERLQREAEYREYLERERQRRQRQQEEERFYQQQRQQQRQQHQQQQSQNRSHPGKGASAAAAHNRAPSPQPDESEDPQKAFSRRFPLPQTRQQAFAVLNIPQSSNEQQIKKAYRHGALVLHPDKNPGNEMESTVRYQQLQEAFNLLNPQKGGRKRRVRSKYRKTKKTHRHTRRCYKTHHRRHRHRHRHGPHKTHRY
jgi:hypothetical protein